MRQPTRRFSEFFFAAAILLVFAGASAAQVDIGTTPPGSGGSPWSAPKWDEPKSEREPTEGPRVKVKRPRSIRCKIHQVEELGRLYVEEVGGDQFWIQLPSSVKISAADPRQFDGRRKLLLEDLAVGQRLQVTVRGEDEIRKVKVLPPRAKEPKVRLSRTSTRYRSSP